MKLARLIYTILIAGLLVTACGTPTASGGTPASGSLPTPEIFVTSAPDANTATKAFLDSWSKDDYAAMYAMLTSTSAATITQEDFTKRYNSAMNNLSLEQLEYVITSTTTRPQSAEVAVHIIFHTVLVGNLERDITMQWQLENGQWKLAWSDGLIMPELANGNTLFMDYKIPTRGNIYDRNGNPIASEESVVAIGLQPGLINPDQEEGMLIELANATGRTPEEIAASYAYAQPNWYIPVGEISAKDYEERGAYIESYSGVLITTYEARYYYDNGLAPQSVGYVTGIGPEVFDSYRRQGYSGTEEIGFQGLEKWGEEFLAGRNGGTLYVVAPDGSIVTSLGRSDPTPASSIFLTLDRDLQRETQDAIKGFNAAAVVIERDTGRVLAIASAPGLDTNVFAAGNPNRQLLLDANYMANEPLFNRAAQGEYPLGSVFKIITLAAALESGSFKPTDMYDCQYEFIELEGRTLYDWTWQHYQDELATTGEGKTQPSGMLSLPDGLMRSCNPWFWHIGLTLFKEGKTTAISDMARAFGLGQATGISQIAESTGNISDPTDAYLAVNEAIGQDPVTVTPLQVARFIAALGNNGTLYRPQLVEKIESPGGDITQIFKPEAQGNPLPIKPDNLQVIQDAMRSVVTNPRGTAYFRFTNIRIPVYGKTGTAETGFENPHAWFAGYTDAQIEGKPDIAIVAFVQNQGEGSIWAAPIFKRILESYFFGRPQSLYPWESNFGVTRTPTPPVTPTDTETPTPEPGFEATPTP